MFGINGAELIVLLLVGLLVVGPERLPSYAEQLGAWVRSSRQFLSTAKDRVATELGEEAADVDWASLDPRRYDPRRIVREALLDDSPPQAAPTTGPRYTTGAARRAAAAAAAAGGTAAGGTTAGGTGEGPAAPFDDEAT